MRRKWFFIVPAALAAMVLFALAGGEVVRLLWNWLLPPLFGWPALTFWQALGLLVLCRILFGGFGRRGGSYMMRQGMRERIKARMNERWDRMTPEERERFRQGIRARCGFGPVDEGKAGGSTASSSSAS